MKKLLLIVTLLLPLCAGARQMKSAFLWDIGNVSISRNGNGMTIDLEFNILNDGVAARSAIVLQPYLTVGGKRSDMRPVSFYRLDSRGNRYNVRSDSRTASGRDDEYAYICGMSKGRKKYTCTLGELSKVDSIEIVVNVSEFSKNNRRKLIESRKVASFVPSPKPEFYPDLFPVYVEEGAYGNARTLVLPLYVTYSASRPTVFDVKYEDNEGDIFDFVTALKPVFDSKNVKVKSVRMKSYAGIEGPASSNRKIADARLKSLMSYLGKQKPFLKRKVTSEVVGEDWARVESWFSSGSWSSDPVLRSAVESHSDSGERKLRDNAVFWKSISENLFPQLDRFECVVEYELLPYGGDEERLQAFYDSSLLLTPYDYSRLLRFTDLWGGLFCDIAYSFAVEFPACREAQVDAFAAALSLGNPIVAGRYLRYLKSDDNSRYYRAVWQTYMGDVDGAFETIAPLMGKEKVYQNTALQIERLYRWHHAQSPMVVNVYSRYR